MQIEICTEKYNTLQIRQDVANVIGISINDISDDDNLYDLGLDSMRLVCLILEWQKKGISIDFTSLAKKSTLQEFSEILNGVKQLPEISYGL